MVSIYAAEGSSSDEVTTSTNTTGVWDTVMEISPSEGTALVFKNTGPSGSSKRGIPIYAKLKDGSDNDLPANTEVALAYKKVGEDDFTNVSEKFGQITDYNNNSISNQQDSDKVDTFKHALDDPQAWIVADVDTFAVRVKSSTAVDHSNTTILFEPAYVEERPMDR